MRVCSERKAIAKPKGSADPNSRVTLTSRGAVNRFEMGFGFWRQILNCGALPLHPPGMMRSFEQSHSQWGLLTRCTCVPQRRHHLNAFSDVSNADTRQPRAMRLTRLMKFCNFARATNYDRSETNCSILIINSYFINYSQLIHRRGLCICGALHAAPNATLHMRRPDAESECLTSKTIVYTVHHLEGSFL